MERRQAELKASESAKYIHHNLGDFWNTISKVFHFGQKNLSNHFFDSVFLNNSAVICKIRSAEVALNLLHMTAEIFENFRSEKQPASAIDWKNT